ncbi:MAG: hypothetical protein M1399_04105 [Actinobacteria bacterium]|nr:hypothetical protein [Actinomycetota bacterium]
MSERGRNPLARWRGQATWTLIDVTIRRQYPRGTVRNGRAMSGIWLVKRCTRLEWLADG